MWIFVNENIYKQYDNRYFFILAKLTVMNELTSLPKYILHMKYCPNIFNIWEIVQIYFTYEMLEELIIYHVNSGNSNSLFIPKSPLP